MVPMLGYAFDIALKYLKTGACDAALVCGSQLNLNMEVVVGYYRFEAKKSLPRNNLQSSTEPTTTSWILMVSRGHSMHKQMASSEPRQFVLFSCRDQTTQKEFMQS